ncbi:MAG TPA: type III toxin-antitoxin system ToxN/AbiQ family toxin [Clostridiales bacterium]|nr:MAG: hypothetical protein A2Y22_01540 [Clostridiales bacterium GWD2_32_59]HAN09504.1 type III toxin-antitoxin system ToxN/AbiQ family toxin [Clostridiales bacterium]
MIRLEFYYINLEYAEFLRGFDSRVSYLKDGKEHRPYVGVILLVDSINYFAPLSSPKLKHIRMKNKQDFIKINNGKWGAINFNNMIPVHIDCCREIEINNIEDSAYKDLLRNQLSWCNSKREHLEKIAFRLHELIITDKADSGLKSRCCDFKVLEKKCREWN